MRLIDKLFRKSAPAAQEPRRFTEQPAVVRGIFEAAFKDLKSNIGVDKGVQEDDHLPALVTFHNGKLGDSPSLADRFFATPEVKALLKEEGLAFHNAFPTRIALAPAADAPVGSLGDRMRTGIAQRKALTSGAPSVGA